MELAASPSPTAQSGPQPPPPSNSTLDEVKNLPGLSFNFTNAMYSGYLNATPGVFLHYWLITSENRASDPLILWLNGGPGCSSLGGLLTENGPFRASRDGSTLYENPFAWTKVGKFFPFNLTIQFSYS